MSGKRTKILRKKYRELGENPPIRWRRYKKDEANTPKTS